MIEETAGQYIRRTRKAAGFSQRKLGGLVGISHVFIGRIEQGIRRVPDKRIDAIARALPGADAVKIRDLNRDRVASRWATDVRDQLVAMKGEDYVADRGLSGTLRTLLYELKAARGDLARRDRADLAESRGCDPGVHGRTCQDCHRWSAGRLSGLCAPCAEKRDDQ